MIRDNFQIKQMRGVFTAKNPQNGEENQKQIQRAPDCFSGT